MAVADRFRDCLIDQYESDIGSEGRDAEAFEDYEYGRRLTERPTSERYR